MSNNPKVQTKSGKILLLLGILCIAINLRPALASIGPLVEDIRKDTGLSSTLIGLLTTLPLIIFGIVSTLTPIFTRRFGIGGTLLGAMFLLIIGICVRSIDWIPALYLGTLIFGIAIALGNVLLPSLTKRNFESNSGFVTSLYSSFMALGASIAAGVSVPLAYNLGLGWRHSLGVWSILAAVALIVWIPQLTRLKESKQKQNFLKNLKKLTNSRLAWQVALFMGFQSLTFYVLLAWLPTILQSRGYDASYSGWMLSLSQATGIIGSLIIPFLAGKQKDQCRIVLILVIIEIIGLLGLLFPQLGWITVWVTLIGFVLGGTFGLVLLFIVLRAKDSESAMNLSGMAQSIGYFVAATGPIFFGRIYDLTTSWAYPIALLILIAFLKLFMGMKAGRDRKLE